MCDNVLLFMGGGGIVEGYFQGLYFNKISLIDPYDEARMYNKLYKLIHF